MNRSIVVSILLSIVTCGIYGIYWFVKLNDELNAAAGKQNAPSGGVAFLLTLVTCGIYGFYWAYKMGENVDIIKSRAGVPSGNSAILYIVLAIFGFQIINYCFMQDAVNNYVANN